MAPVYAIVAYPFAWRYRTPMALWYVHRHVDLKLRLAEKLVDGVFSASPESFRLPSKKVSFLGHGVDTDLFAPPAAVPAGFVMLTAGRISRSKRVDFLLRAVARAREHLPSAWKFMIVGGLITGDDARYRQELDKLIRDLGMGEHVSFEGEVPYRGMPSYYQKAHMFLHASATGSIDKAVLEAMSTALPVVSSSEAFWTILPEEYVVKERSVETFASKISALLRKGRDMSLRGIVQEKFELSDLIKKLEMQLIALSVPID
ncbi:MAG: glycosyltransferase [Candidatus Sungbacteria bacterium]|uniref:Glycosyltransferase n=1 Tax=Candidatus Sungiibacteriota bacterium TaxID=2750080 RepID=A0A931WP83_9BACT|nr:glycosyltransferase [Candidatus Sungbacteria bacterium]